jgi:NAD(P)-dependent dehydrogenase (short-subunit alcohol dehydrogenase family)
VTPHAFSPDGKHIVSGSVDMTLRLWKVATGRSRIIEGHTELVSAVGPTLSEGVEDMLKEAAEKSGQSIKQAAEAFVKEMRPSSIIRRPATTEEIANMVIYAVSPQASATTGAALRVDGAIVDTIA